MSDPTIEKISIGLVVCGIAIFVWASIDYNRFIKFWMVRPSPYTQRVRLLFRFFFLACIVGGVWQLIDAVSATGRPAIFYLNVLPFAMAWFVVFFLMLHLVEWMNRKRRSKQ
jgi:hypothetical protein